MLDNTNKKMPFKVPDGYFEKLQDRIERRIDSVEPNVEENFEPRLGHKIWLRLRPVLYVAAVVAITYGISFVATLPLGNVELPGNGTFAETYELPETYEEEVEFYYIEDMDIYDVYEFLSMNE